MRLSPGLMHGLAANAPGRKAQAYLIAKERRFNNQNARNADLLS